MKRIILLLAVCFVAFATVASGQKREKLLLGGSHWNDIVILDKESGQIEWRYHITDKNLECNSLAMTEDGSKIFLTYKEGVRLIDRATSETLWDHKVEENQEVHTAKIYGKRFVMAICGTPAKIVEFDIKGKVKKELSVDTQIENRHSQFRQVTKLSNGNYVMPMFSRGLICELSPKGEIVREVKSVGIAFSVKEMADGKWLYGAGDSHKWVIVDPATGENIKIVESPLLAFAAEPLMGENGSVLVCSWVGHSNNKNEPKMVEFDREGNVIWTLAADKEGVGMVSAAYRFFE